MRQKIRIIANDSSEFQCLTTDLVNGKPPIFECGTGSTMMVLDPLTKKLSKVFKFYKSDNAGETDWYEL